MRIVGLLAAASLIGGYAWAKEEIPPPAPPLLQAAGPPPSPAQKAARAKNEAADSVLWNKNPAPKDPRDFSGVWWTSHYQREIRQLDGSHPPMTQKGIDSENYRVDLIKKGTPLPDASTECLPNGVPHTMVSPYPIQFVYSPGLITMLFEVGHDLRFIHMDGKPAPKNEPLSFMGYSVGHWEGNTLVVVTDHFNNKTTIDQTSLSHGTKMKVTERFSRYTDKFGGAQITDMITIDDPDYYTKPWVARRDFAWRGDTHMLEYTCEENNRNQPVDGLTGYQ